MFNLGFSASNALAGASLLGVAGGVLGSFALLRRQSLLGDALAHAALPGVCIGYLLTQSKSALPLFAGALVTGLAGAMLILVIVRMSRLKEDSAIGIVLSVFFGMGIVLLTHIQKLPFANQSGLDKYLFGQAATLVTADVRLMAVLCGLVLVVTAFVFKEFKLISFDIDYAASLGLPVRRLEVLLTLLLVIVVVVGLRTVGVVLIVATLVTPAAAARQWTERLGLMVVLSGAIGGASGACGALISASFDRLPTGPVIVLCASAVLVVSLVAAPQRGLLGALWRERAVAQRIREENLLKDLYVWGERTGTGFGEPVPDVVLMGDRGQTALQVARAARRPRSRKLVERVPLGLCLTERGQLAAADVVRKHRLWETYLTRRLDLPSDHVHRDADVMEHALTDAAVARLAEVLGHPEIDPHGRRIPPARPA